jgi:hypothetical protein
VVDVITFQDAIRGRVPRWLLGHWGYRFLYSLAIQFDAIAHTAVAGMKAGWPGAYTVETLPLLGRQRRVLRGPKWSDAKYAVAPGKAWVRRMDMCAPAQTGKR